MEVVVPGENDAEQTVFIVGEASKVKTVKDQLLKTLKDLANLTVVEIKVDPRFHKTIIGKKGETIKKLNDEFESCAIKVPTPEGSSDLVIIRGPKDDVERLRKQVVQLVEDTRHHEIMHSYTVNFQIDKKAVKFIIGKSGAVINRLREQFEVSIEIEQTADDKPEAAAPAAAAVAEMPVVVEKKAASEKKPAAAEEKAPASDKGKGKKEEAKKPEEKKEGEAKKAAEPKKAADAKKEEPKKKEGEAKKASPAPTPAPAAAPAAADKGKVKKEEGDTAKVTIVGLKKNVEEAKEALIEKAKEFTEGGGLVTVDLHIDPKYHGALIGAQGKFVKSLVDRHSITVRFPRSDAPSDLVVLSGMKKSVEKAQAELLELLEYEKSISHTQTVTAENALLRQAMGLGTISKQRAINITDTTHTQIEFENGNKSGNRVVIRGTSKDVAEAKKLLEKFVEELSNTVTEEIEVDPKHHGTIIGAKGARIREISEKHNGVDIRLPQDKTSKVVRLTGSAKDVEGAKATIQDLVKGAGAAVEDKASTVTKDWTLARKYYPGLKDYLRANGTDIRVRVTFPEQGETVSVKGKEEEIEAAIVLFEKNLEESVTLKFPRELHPAMLANGKIKEINTSLGVVIRFPDRESQSQNVTVRGKAESLAAAEKALNQLAEEAKVKKEEYLATREPSDRGGEILKVDPAIVGRVIGRSGSNVQNISKVSGARINIRKDSGEIVLTGSKEATAFALQQFKDLIEEIQSRVTEVVRVNPDYYARLAGKGFSSLHKIQDDFGVTIKIPKDKGDDAISVSGGKEDVAAAIEYIKEVVKEIVIDLKNDAQDRQWKEAEAKEKDRPKQPQTQANGSGSGSHSHRQTIKADDPFFAPPPSSAPSVDRTSVWGAKMS